MTAYQVGETIRLKASITDSDGVLGDPATVKIQINRPDETEDIVALDMTNTDVGLYYYDYSIPNELGTYSWNVTAVGAGDRITIVKDRFSVNPAIGD